MGLCGYPTRHARAIIKTAKITVTAKNQPQLCNAQPTDAPSPSDQPLIPPQLSSAHFFCACMRFSLRYVYFVARANSIGSEARKVPT